MAVERFVVRRRLLNRTFLITIAAVSAVLMLAIAVHLYFFQYMLDDPYISFRYARNLVLGRGLVFNPGEYVEGYTNFLWVMLIALTMWFGADPVISSKVMGVIIGVSTVLSLYYIAPLVGCKGAWQRLLPPLFLASSFYFGLWNIGGLETGLFALLSLLGIALFYSEMGTARAPIAGVFFALSAMTRPDGVLFLGAAFAWGLIEIVLSDPDQRRVLVRHLFVTTVVFAALFVPYFIWRWTYYGDILPNTFYAKTAGGVTQRLFGINYITNYIASKTGLWLLLGVKSPDLVQFLMFPSAKLLSPVVLAVSSGIALWYWLRLRMRFIGLLFCSIVIYLVYVIQAGGDWMLGFRFVVPVLPMGMLFVGCAVLNLFVFPRARRGGILYSACLVCLAATILASNLVIESMFIRSVVPWLRPWYELRTLSPSGPYYDIALWLRDNVEKDALVAIGEAGIIPYYSDVRILDILGLTDPHIARLPGLLHYKGDADYVLARKPEYMVLLAVMDPQGRVKYAIPPMQQFFSSGDFLANYRLVKRLQRGADSFLIYTPNYEVVNQNAYDFFRKREHAVVSRPENSDPNLTAFDIDGDYRPVLFAQGPTTFEFDISVPDGPSHITFSTAEFQRAWEWGGDGITFVLSVVADGTETKLFERYLDPGRRAEDRAWVDGRVDLTPFAGRRVQVRFITAPGPSGDTKGDWGGWARPLLERENTTAVGG